jgi:ELWxxDGT repeat protein
VVVVNTLIVFAGSCMNSQERHRDQGRRFSIESLEERSVLAADFELLMDSTTSSFSYGSQPTELTRVGAIAFVVAWMETTGAELWKTDGTAAGTVMVKDIYGGRNGSAPAQLTNVNGALYFMANDGVNGPELWRSDGTAAGTQRLSTTAIPNSIGPAFAEIAAVGDLIYFTAQATASQMGLWKTDGTAVGTVLLRSFSSSFFETRIRQLTEMNGALYFFANDGTKGMELWKSDGTTDGTAIVKDIYSGSLGAIPALGSWIDADLVNAGGTLFFSATSPNSLGRYDLWKSDGTAPGTVMLKASPNSNPGFAAQQFFEFNGNAYFVANDGAAGWELWKSDGTASGTAIVKDIASGFPSGMPTTGLKAADPLFTVHNGQLYFIAGSFNARALWRTDGSAAGTTWVSTLPVGTFQFEGLQLTSALGKLFLLGGNGDDDVYVSDGQSTNWQKLAQLESARFLSANSQYAPTPKKSFLELGSRVLLSGATLPTGAELWSTDGSIAGTAMLTDIAIHGGSTSAESVEFAGSLYLAVGGKLWKSDGTPQGTINVTTSLAGPNVFGVSGLRLLGGRLYFRAQTEQTGTQFWTSDGTQAGTWRISDVQPPDGDYAINDLTLIDETLYFSARDETGLVNVWQSNGTLAGTTRVAGFLSKANKQPTNFTVLGDELFFAGEDALGIDLWAVKGGIAQKLYEFDNGGEPRSLTVVNGQLFFTADDGSINRELWKTDGTTAGTVQVKEINPVGSTNPSNLINLGGVLYFTANDGEYISALWRSDGTEEGTYRVAGLRQSGTGSGALNMLEMNGVLYFTADDGIDGVEIWRSNGTSEGTFRVTSLASGTASGFPTLLTNIYGTLYFSAYDDVHGEELWKSDGTSEGTSLAKDFAPGSGGSAIRWISGYRGGVMVAAITPEYGREVWTQMPESRGDYNGDGVTDGADFLAWQRAFGAAATPAGSGADGDGDGSVGIGDLAVWKANYGWVAESPASPASVSANAPLVANISVEEHEATAPRQLRLLDEFDAAFASFGGSEAAALAGPLAYGSRHSAARAESASSYLHRKERDASLQPMLPQGAMQENRRAARRTDEAAAVNGALPAETADADAFALHPSAEQKPFSWHSR